MILIQFAYGGDDAADRSFGWANDALQPVDVLLSGWAKPGEYALSGGSVDVDVIARGRVNFFSRCRRGVNVGLPFQIYGNNYTYWSCCKASQSKCWLKWSYLDQSLSWSSAPWIQKRLSVMFHKIRMLKYYTAGSVKQMKMTLYHLTLRITEDSISITFLFSSY